MTSIHFSDFLYFKNDLKRKEALRLVQSMNYNKMAKDLQPRRLILQEAALHLAPESSGIIPRSITFLSIKSIRQLKRPMGARTIRLGWQQSMWSAEVHPKLPLRLLSMRKLVLKHQP